MLIGLFDIVEGVFDEKLVRSYFGDKFNTDLGFYSKRKVQENSVLKKDRRRTLKKYIKNYGCAGFQDFFDWLMKQIKPIRLTGAHHLPLIKQDSISNYKYKIKYKKGIKEVNLGFLEACKTGIIFFLNFIHWVGSYYFFANVKE